MKMKIPSNEKCIQMYLHCGLCLNEMPANGYTQSLEVGWTAHGIQVWCKTHDANVLHIDFEGGKHPANISIADVLGATEIG